MVRFVFRAVLIVLINVVVIRVSLLLIDRNRDFAQWETYSPLYRMPRKADVPWVVLGSSHAERFVGCEEEARYTSAALGGEVVFLTKTASGILQQRLFLQEFYRRGNRADDVVCVLDPFVFFSDVWNEQVPFVEFEPLDLTYLASQVSAGVPRKRMYTYVRSKCSERWLRYRASPRPCTTQSVEQVDPERVQKRISGLYPDGASPMVLDRYLIELDRIVALVRANGGEVHFVSTPTLLGETPGYAPFIDAIREREARYGVRYQDFRTAIQDPALFRDHDHLNTEGVKRFLDEFLGPALSVSETR